MQNPGVISHSQLPIVLGVVLRGQTVINLFWEKPSSRCLYNT